MTANTLITLLKSRQIEYSRPLSKGEIDELIKQVRPTLGMSEAAIDRAVRRFEEENDVRMEIGSVLTGGKWTPWLHPRKPSIHWNYWDRYNQLLTHRNFPIRVISGMDEVTDKTLGLLEDPKKEGKWHRKGLVLGHVQSGKTANYVGLINKAADAGYRVIIVIAGLQEELRKQTQARIEDGFIGYHSVEQGKRLGVGLITPLTRPASFTSRQSDFHIQLKQAALELSSIDKPTVFVIKKNQSTLKHLIKWLSDHNTGNDGLIHNLPMLLIDDEADNASVNTAKDPYDATRINGQIRQVFQLFQQACYVGYTATPFANIFIDKDVTTDDHGDDLFPRDFIISLDPPTNYMGANVFFSEQEDEERKYLREITDCGNLLPLKHKKDFVPDELPPSLHECIRTFLLTLAVRALRGDGKKHASMLVNASRFIDVQSRLRDRIRDEVYRYIRDIKFYSKLPLSESLENSSLSALNKTWKREFEYEVMHDWADVSEYLYSAVVSTEVIEINGASRDSLDYSSYQESGRKVIAVGGFSLSRGLTLEGLSTSYFHRNSIMYDTLLQMARWFGYRPGYEDLCRIWMEPEAIGWFMHIQHAVEELRDEIRKMEKAGMPPKDFGLKVRSHPDALLVTARNKIGTGEKVPHSTDLSKTLTETHRVTNDTEKADQNLRLLETFLSEITSHESGNPKAYNTNSGSYLFQSVPAQNILDFVDKFNIHEDLFLIKKEPITDYIKKGINDELAKWDVVLYGLDKNDDSRVIEFPSGHAIVKQQRTGAQLPETLHPGYRIGSRQRVSSRGIERIGLSRRQVKGINASGGKNIADHEYREARTRPLLMLHCLDLHKPVNNDGGPTRLGELLSRNVVAFGISFPRTKRAHPEVEYVVNKTWLESVFGQEDDTDEELADERSME